MNSFVIKYIDDILVSQKKNQGMHQTNFGNVYVKSYRIYKFCGNGRKHGFGQLEMKLLGHALTQGGATSHDYNMEAIKIGRSGTQKKLRCFFELAYYYQIFIPSFPKTSKSFESLKINLHFVSDKKIPSRRYLWRCNFN